MTGNPPPAVRLDEPIQGERSEFWAHLRSTYGEVAPVWLEPGVRAWLLLSYRVNKEVLTQDHLYARDPRWWRDMEDGTISRNSGTWALWHKRAMALYSDGDEHLRYSRALLAAFAQLDERRTHAHIRAVAEELIDRFVSQGQADLVSDYARPFPLRVMCRLFGLTQEQIAEIIEQTTRTWHGHADAARAMTELLVHVAHQARTHPDPSTLPTLLVREGLSDMEVAEQLGLLLSAGVDPVTHTISTALREILSDPSLAGARSLMLISQTVNLILARHTPMETIVARYPRRDVRLGEYTIRAGECLVAGFAAASDDLYAGLSVDQIASNRAHLTFSAGAHRCPRYGQDLAQDMAETAIAALFDRVPDVRLATRPDEHEWLPTANLRGLVALPISFAPQRPAVPAIAPPEPERTAPAPPSPPQPRRLLSAFFSNVVMPRRQREP